MFFSDFKINETAAVIYSWKNSSNVVVGTSATVPNQPAGTYTLTVNDNCSTLAPPTCTVQILAPSCGGHIFPTATTCCTFKNGTSQKLPEICYTTKAKKVSNATPGVFFYYANLTTTTANTVVNVLQSCSLPTFALYSLNQGQIVIWDASCTKVVTGSESSLGQGTVTVPKAGTYTVSVKYDTKSLIGSPVPGAAPTVNYSFVTKVNGTEVSGSGGSITAKPNCNSGFVNPGTCSAPAPLVDVSKDNNYRAVRDMDNEFFVAPNPANSEIQLTFKADYEVNTAILISDLSGKTSSKFDYRTIKGINNTILSLDNMNNGIYLINVKVDNKQLTQRLVIIK